VEYCSALVNAQRLVDLGKRANIGIVFLVSQALQFQQQLWLKGSSWA
jgi:hypothetical protein